MAEKEASIYIVDVGASMGQRRQGRKENDLEWAMNYVWDKITSAVATDRKTLYQSVIALRSDTTNNDLGSEEGYENINVVQTLKQTLLPDLLQIGDALKPSSTDRGDGMSALVVAAEMIAQHCKKLKYKRTITLVTNGLGHFDTEDADQIAEKIKVEGIQLVILGADFDDAEFGFKEEDKPFAKQKNETALKAFAEQCDGACATLAEAIGELGEPRIKETRPIASYKGTLTLGDPNEYRDTAMVIDIERYPKTMVRRPATASSFIVKKPDDANKNGEGRAAAATDTIMGGTEDANQQGNDGLSSVHNSVKYQIAEKDATGHHITVDRDDLARGYEYGRTAVHITESDEGITKLDTNASCEIIGFVPWANFPRYMSMSTTNIIVAQRSNTKAVMALSSFVHALHELESFAVARLVPKEGKEPIIEMLAPHIEPDIEGLIDVHLPFAEDVRSYRFPPLDKVVTVSGKILKEHRYLPTPSLQSAMDNYVDSMDLSKFGTDDDGNPTEYAPMDSTFSPVLHRIDQAVRFRAVRPNDPMPPPHDVLTRYCNPPAEMLKQTKKNLDTLMAAADVKKVPPKSAGRRKREAIKPLSGLNVTSLLTGRQERQSTTNQRVYVDPKNPIPTFIQSLEDPGVGGTDPKAMRAISQQMGSVIEQLIANDFGNSKKAQVIEMMTTMRSQLIEMEGAAHWNDFIKTLKTKLLAGELGNGADELWYEISQKARLGLKEGEIPGDGIVTDEEARSFLTKKA